MCEAKYHRLYLRLGNLSFRISNFDYSELPPMVIAAPSRKRAETKQFLELNKFQKTTVSCKLQTASENRGGRASCFCLTSFTITYHEMSEKMFPSVHDNAYHISPTWLKTWTRTDWVMMPGLAWQWCLALSIKDAGAFNNSCPATGYNFFHISLVLILKFCLNHSPLVLQLSS